MKIIIFIFRLVVTGFKRPLEDKDIWELEEQYQTESVVKKVEKEWQKELAKMYK